MQESRYGARCVCRLAEDNFMKTCTELAIFATIMTALVLRNDRVTSDKALFTLFNPAEFLLLLLWTLVPVRIRRSMPAFIVAAEKKIGSAPVPAQCCGYRCC